MIIYLLNDMIKNRRKLKQYNNYKANLLKNKL